MTDSFSCTTPRFQEVAEEEGLQWPQDCKVELTLDGIVYVLCETNYLIYSSKLAIQSLYPKCASVEGGTTLMLNINIDDKTSSYMKHLNVGFQPRMKKEKEKEKDLLPSKKDVLTVSKQPPSKKPSSSDLIQKAAESQTQFQNQLNPLDLSTNDPELEKENWICVEGFYDRGKISCTVPKVSDLKTDALNFSVDISINVMLKLTYFLGAIIHGQPSRFPVLRHQDPTDNS